MSGSKKKQDATENNNSNFDAKDTDTKQPNDF